MSIQIFFGKKKQIPKEKYLYAYFLFLESDWRKMVLRNISFEHVRSSAGIQLKKSQHFR